MAKPKRRSDFGQWGQNSALTRALQKLRPSAPTHHWRVIFKDGAPQVEHRLEPVTAPAREG
jgi:hypothetical protein